jgi:uncharacterized protein YndB with AHSA1/START domain
MDRYLRPTALLDHRHPSLQELVDARGWADLDATEAIGAIYTFVRDEIAFGYNAADDVPASAVLADGYGQCNTKTTLLMALLRAVGVPVRFHGATVHKRLQRGVVRGLLYRLAPADIIHSWAEVHHDDRWVGLEGVILDTAYLNGVRTTIATPRTRAFLGYGVGTDDLADPPVDWNGTDTAIQATGVNHDYGVYDDPDTFYRSRGTNLTGPRAWLFRNRVRHVMNRRVATIRTAGGGSACPFAPTAQPPLAGPLPRSGPAVHRLEPVMASDVHVEETIDIGAPPQTVYDTITDVARWGRFSPECTGATVVHDNGPLRVGSRFRGHNRRGPIRRWTTHCTVTAAEPGRLFTFDTAAIGLPVATWSYRLEPLDGGTSTRLTEVWHDDRGPLMRTIAVAASGVRDRATHNRASMRATLAAVKDHLETTSASQQAS